MLDVLNRRYGDLESSLTLSRAAPSVSSERGKPRREDHGSPFLLYPPRLPITRSLPDSRIGGLTNNARSIIIITGYLDARFDWL